MQNLPWCGYASVFVREILSSWRWNLRAYFLAQGSGYDEVRKCICFVFLSVLEILFKLVIHDMHNKFHPDLSMFECILYDVITLGPIVGCVTSGSIQ